MNFKVFWFIVLFFIIIEVSGEHKDHPTKPRQDLTGDHIGHFPNHNENKVYPRCRPRRTTASPAATTAGVAE